VPEGLGLLVAVEGVPPRPPEPGLERPLHRAELFAGHEVRKQDDSLAVELRHEPVDRAVVQLLEGDRFGLGLVTPHVVSSPWHEKSPVHFEVLAARPRG
jgi:hypothetical protein